MVEVKSFLENVVFIDGLYTENPRFDIEMTTTATIQDKDSFSGPSSLRAAKEESRLPFEVVSQAPYVKNTGKLPEKTVLRERRKFYCVIALLSLIIVIGAAGGVFAYFSFGKSTNETFFVPSSPTVALVIQTTTSIGPYVNPSVTGQNSVLSSATAAETPIIFASDSQSLIASVSDFSTSSTQTPNTSQMPIFFASDTNSLVGPASGFSTSSTQTPTTSATTIFFASDSQSLIASVSVVSTSSTQTPTTSETPIFFATDTQSLIGTSSSSAHAPTNSYATNIDTTSTQSFFMSSSAANNPATSLTTTSNLQTTTSAVQTTRSTSIRTITRTASPTATVTTIISDDAALNQIHGITIDENDNIYVIAPNKRVINKITFNGTAAVMEKIANLSTDGQSGSYDQGICYFNNALYVPRWGQLTKIDLANNNLVTRFAGSGIPGGVNPGQNSSATFCGAISCTIDNQGNIYVAEECNAIRKVNQTGYVSNVGLGLPIKPNSLLIKNDSTLLFTGWYPTVIYSIGLINSQVTALTMDSVAGNSGMIYDELGNLYVAETERHGIAKFNATTYSSIQFAGYTSSGKHDDVGSAARFNKPRQIAIDTKGRLFVADQNNNAIRMITW